MNVILGNWTKARDSDPDARWKRMLILESECYVFADGDVEKPLLVTIYIANKQEKPPLPNTEYKRLIVEGAKYWHLPEEYIKGLDKIETAPK